MTTRERIWRYIRHGWPRGAIWGVANSWPLPVVYAPANDVTLTAGAEVQAITTTNALVGNPGQSYVPIIFGCACITMGGTASAALTLAARYHSGTDFATQVIPAGVLANSAVLTLPLMLVGASVLAAGNGNVGTGAIEITGAATTTACTWTKIGTAVTIMLIPGQ
jgi:hypothetical protein